MYQDRGMMKWMGFILSEHSEDIKMRNKKETSPIFLDEQAITQYNDLLCESYEFHSTIKIASSNPHNLHDAVKNFIGYVSKYDFIKKGILFRLEDGTQEFIPFISIRLVSEVN